MDSAKGYNRANGTLFCTIFWSNYGANRRIFNIMVEERNIFLKEE